jgi:hypothetical protein
MKKILLIFFIVNNLFAVDCSKYLLLLSPSHLQEGYFVVESYKPHSFSSCQKSIKKFFYNIDDFLSFIYGKTILLPNEENDLWFIYDTSIPSVEYPYENDLVPYMYDINSHPLFNDLNSSFQYNLYDTSGSAFDISISDNIDKHLDSSTDISQYLDDYNSTHTVIQDGNKLVDYTSFGDDLKSAVLSYTDNQSEQLIVNYKGLILNILKVHDENSNTFTYIMQDNQKKVNTSRTISNNIPLGELQLNIDDFENSYYIETKIFLYHAYFSLYASIRDYKGTNMEDEYSLQFYYPTEDNSEDLVLHSYLDSTDEFSTTLLNYNYDDLVDSGKSSVSNTVSIKFIDNPIIDNDSNSDNSNDDSSSGGISSGGGSSNNNIPNNDNNTSTDDTVAGNCDDGAPKLLLDDGSYTCDRSCEKVNYISSQDGICKAPLNCQSLSNECIKYCGTQDNILNFECYTSDLNKDKLDCTCVTPPNYDDSNTSNDDNSTLDDDNSTLDDDNSTLDDDNSTLDDDNSTSNDDTSNDDTSNSDYTSAPAGGSGSGGNSITSKLSSLEDSIKDLSSSFKNFQPSVFNGDNNISVNVELDTSFVDDLFSLFDFVPDFSILEDFSNFVDKSSDSYSSLVKSIDNLKSGYDTYTNNYNDLISFLDSSKNVDLMSSVDASNIVLSDFELNVFGSKISTNCLFGIDFYSFFGPIRPFITFIFNTLFIIISIKMYYRAITNNMTGV